MSEHVFKTVELVGSSEVGIEDAAQKALSKASKSIHGIRWFEVSSIRGWVKDDTQIGHWQVTMKVGFKIDE